MQEIGSSIIEIEPGIYLTSECSGDSWGRSRKIERAHIMGSKWAEEQLRSWKYNYPYDYSESRTIKLYADL